MISSKCVVKHRKTMWHLLPNNDAIARLVEAPHVSRTIFDDCHMRRLPYDPVNTTVLWSYLVLSDTQMMIMTMILMTTTIDGCHSKGYVCCCNAQAMIAERRIRLWTAEQWWEWNNWKFKNLAAPLCDSLAWGGSKLDNYTTENREAGPGESPNFRWRVFRWRNFRWRV